MELDVQPGTYIVAVSGGVDSVVLLHMLASRPGLNLTVAHFDHGIRPESAQDAAFVAGLADRYGLPFVSERTELGPGASEDRARQARYEFLRRTQAAHGARAIITAHHQDDVLETAILNLLRGTGRRGLSSLRNTVDIIRPLLGVSKQDILDYAHKQNLSWQEDSTNRDERYLRNYIRHRVLVRFDAPARRHLLEILDRAQMINDELDVLIRDALQDLSAGHGALDRHGFSMLSHTVSKEIMAAWLRTQGLADFDRHTIERLTLQAKTKPAGKSLDVLHGYRLEITKQELALWPEERYN